MGFVSEQYSLQPDDLDVELESSVTYRQLFPNHADSESVHVFNEHSIQISPRPPEHRRLAVSEHTVSRNNAFRNRTYVLNQAMYSSYRLQSTDEEELESALQSTQDSLHRMMDSPEKENIPCYASTPRVPKPSSPSLVCLQEVCDISLAAPEAFRRLSCTIRPVDKVTPEASVEPVTPAVPVENATPEAPRRPRRFTMAPSNFKDYHSTGQFGEGRKRE